MKKWQKTLAQLLIFSLLLFYIYLAVSVIYDKTKMHFFNTEKYKSELEIEREKHINQINQYKELYKISSSKIDSLEQVRIKEENTLLLVEKRLKNLLAYNKRLSTERDNLLDEKINAINIGDTTVINNERAEYRKWVRTGQ